MTRYPYPILDFEREEDPEGELIPLCMRMKLDLAGYKVGLNDWQRLSRTTRQALLSMHIDSDWDLEKFRQKLTRALIDVNCEQPEPLPDSHLEDIAQWKTASRAPSTVEQLAHRFKISIRWQELNLFERYVLWHLAKKGKAQRFLAFCREFQGSASKGEGD